MTEKERVANLEEHNKAQEVLAAFKVTAEALEKSGDRGFMIVYRLARKALTLEESGLERAANGIENLNRTRSICRGQYKFECWCCGESAFEWEEIIHDLKCPPGWLSKALTAFREADK